MNKSRFFTFVFSTVFFILLLLIETNGINPLNKKVPLGHLTYNLNHIGNPNADNASAYKLIKQVMDSAVYFSNLITQATGQINVNYVNEKGVRADGGPGGIRFGPERTYMNVGTALHEIAHIFGVGNFNKWPSFMTFDAPTGKIIFKGEKATKMLRQITGDKNAHIYMDNQHFWPYGLNYVSEYKIESDLINNCKIVKAMIEDGLPLHF